jgi:hypothetical protein
VNSVLLLCPHCGQKGSVSQSLVGGPVECAGCRSKFIALRPSFWERQKLNSPLVQYWWLWVAVALVIAVFLGQVSLLTGLAVIAVCLLFGIFLHVTRIASRKSQ